MCMAGPRLDLAGLFMDAALEVPADENADHETERDDRDQRDQDKRHTQDGAEEMLHVMPSCRAFYRFGRDE